jgi:phosphoribosyl 1,2-cyclic phosphodiesterase
VKVRIWGARGSLSSPGPATARYGGNTSSVEVRGPDGGVLVLDAGTGIRALGPTLVGVPRVDIVLSHLHMDHIQGLGFFKPLFEGDTDVHLWGPAATAGDLGARLARYLSPPLFPVHLRDLTRLTLHALPWMAFRIGAFRLRAERICHPGLTIGVRLEADERCMAYLSDHEPALGHAVFPSTAEWTSGHALAEGADLLVHDAQYSREEYSAHVGWGHSSIDHAIAFGHLAGVRRLATFHHDPAHDDDDLERMTAEAVGRLQPTFPVAPAFEGQTVDLA